MSDCTCPSEYVAEVEEYETAFGELPPELRHTQRCPLSHTEDTVKKLHPDAAPKPPLKRDFMVMYHVKMRDGQQAARWATRARMTLEAVNLITPSEDCAGHVGESLLDNIGFVVVDEQNLELAEPATIFESIDAAIAASEVQAMQDQRASWEVYALVPLEFSGECPGDMAE